MPKITSLSFWAQVLNAWHFCAWEISCGLVRCMSQTWKKPKNIHAKSLISFNPVPGLQAYSGTSAYDGTSDRKKTHHYSSKVLWWERSILVLVHVLPHILNMCTFFSSGRLRRPINLCSKRLLLCVWPCELGWRVRVTKQARSLYPGDNISQLD